LNAPAFADPGSYFVPTAALLTTGEVVGMPLTSTDETPGPGGEVVKAPPSQQKPAGQGLTETPSNMKPCVRAVGKICCFC
jgi:hypothetical protein